METKEPVIYVVMRNDYPDAVFSTLERAEAYCTEKRKEPPLNRRGSSRIYWRVYDFVLDGEERWEWSWTAY